MSDWVQKAAEEIAQRYLPKSAWYDVMEQERGVIAAIIQRHAPASEKELEKLRTWVDERVYDSRDALECNIDAPARLRHGARLEVLYAVQHMLKGIPPLEEYVCAICNRTVAEAGVHIHPDTSTEPTTPGEKA